LLKIIISYLGKLHLRTIGDFGGAAVGGPDSKPRITLKLAALDKREKNWGS